MAALSDIDLDATHPLVAQAVLAHGLQVRPVACDPGLADTAEFCAAYGVSLQDSANTIVVIGKGPEPAPLAACLVLATHRLDVNGAVRRSFGTKKASFAPQDLACERTGMERGGVTVVGLPEGMPLWIDEAVMARLEIVVGGGNRTSKLLCAPSELLKLPDVIVIEGLANLTPARSEDGST